MEPGGSMPHSQGLSNNSFPEPNQLNSPHLYYLFKVHSNIGLPSTPRPPQKSLSVGYNIINIFNDCISLYKFKSQFLLDLIQ